MPNVCMQFIVRGQVQGVFYRSNARQQAKTLNLTGWVRNLSTGEVELLVCGEKASVEALHEWLWNGPRLASVKRVDCKEVPWEEHRDFVVTY